MVAVKSIIRRMDEVSIPVPVLIRIFLGAYFVHTGFNKVQDPFAFLKVIRLYEMLPEAPPYFLNGTAVILPWLEIVCGLVLVLGVFVRGAGALIAGMFCVFSPAILLRAVTVMGEQGISFFQIEFDCGCGMGKEIIWIKLCKNTGLLLLTIVTIVSRSRRYSLTMWFDRRRATATYCRRCGYPVPESDGGQCKSCADSSAVPAGTAGAA